MADDTMQQQQAIAAGLKINDLKVSVDGKLLLDGLNLTIKPGEIHAIMGPNGAGKSTLSLVIAGHPKYKVESGQIMYNGVDLLTLPPSERAKQGIFLAFQYPLEVPGVNLGHFLFSICKARNPKLSPIEFRKQLEATQKILGMDPAFTNRELNVGFSGGEKKRAEVLQLLLTRPSLAILDETDSGLDIDALQLVAKAIHSLKSPGFSAIIVSHHLKILDSLHPDKVHILRDGRIIESGSIDLAQRIEKEGFSGAGDAGDAR